MFCIWQNIRASFILFSRSRMKHCRDGILAARRYSISRSLFLLQGILKGEYHCTFDILFDWFGLVCLANKSKNCQSSYSWFQTSQTGGQQYSDTSPFSIPWLLLQRLPSNKLRFEALAVQSSSLEFVAKLGDFKSLHVDRFPVRRLRSALNVAVLTNVLVVFNSLIRVLINNTTSLI